MSDGDTKKFSLELLLQHIQTIADGQAGIQESLSAIALDVQGVKRDIDWMRREAGELKTASAAHATKITTLEAEMRLSGNAALGIKVEALTREVHDLRREVSEMKARAEGEDEASTKAETRATSWGQWFAMAILGLMAALPPACDKLFPKPETPAPKSSTKSE